MCGIAVFWNPDGLDERAEADLGAMIEAQRHRGPDGDGRWVDRERGVALGHARLAIIEAVVHGAPDLVVEIASPASRRQDEVLKRGLYERAGVEEYWLVDPEAETVKVFRRGESGYGRPVLLSAREGDRLESPLLPGLEIPLAAVFAE